MTSQSPRIYTYKITFEEVSYYYYGVHKERKFGEEYLGSPQTNKWCWEFYTPKKQILEFFDYSDEGWLKALEVEKRLISPVYQIDKLCLNASCGLKIALNILRKNGRKIYERKVGIHAFTTEQRQKIGSKSGKKVYEMGIGIHAFSLERRQELGRNTGLYVYKNKKGIHGMTYEQRKEICRKIGLNHKENKTALFAQTKEKMTENGKKGGKVAGQLTYELGIGIHGQSKEKRRENGKKACKITNSQKWKCCITGYVSTAAGVVSYQKGRGIDTSKNNRVKVLCEGT